MKAATIKTTKPLKTVAPVAIVATVGETGEDAVRVLKRGICPTLSGKSNVSFEIGVDSRGDVCLRVVQNSGHGSFSDTWVRFKEIQAALERAPKGAPVSSFLLSPLLRGVSGNTVGFIWAVLVKEGIVAPSATTKRRYDRLEPTAFLAQVRDLMDGRVVTAAGEKKSQKPAAAKVGVDKPKKGNKSPKT